MQPWKFLRVTGPRDLVKTIIGEAKDVPEAARFFMRAQVDALPEDVYAVNVHAYGEIHEGPQMLVNIQVSLTAFRPSAPAKG